LSRKSKLVEKFLAKRRDFTYKELATLLKSLGYREVKSGKTAGSRVAFFHEKSGNVMRLHKPHPANVLKRYQLDDIERELRRKGFLP
jgi:predicted RNA binding protein YcfA (HicA-like mRNA interferase family)